ncbi:MAG: DUF2309 domain-containing protein [Myxococcales bacterium]
MDESERLHEAVAEAAHLLPSQAPIRIFVHHNTLHALEHLPFDQAVAEAEKIYGAEPYLSEAAFAEHLRSGRILPFDMEAVLGDHFSGEDDHPVLEGGPSRSTLWSLRLRHLFEVPRGPALSWLLEETDVLRRLHPAVGPDARARLLQCGSEAEVLERLWHALKGAGARRQPERERWRTRDALLVLTGADTDELVHPLLIRVCAAFVDQGIAYWRMPMREAGLWKSFCELYGNSALPPLDRWMAGLDARLREMATRGLDAEDAVLELLGELGVDQDDWDDFIGSSLLALRGWAGMMHQLEVRPDRAPVKAPPARLMDFLAVRLALDVQAARHVLRDALGQEDRLTELSRHRAPRRERAGRELAYEAYVMAQLAGVGPDRLATSGASRAWLEAVAEIDELQRRRLLHEAYERRHRVEFLDALSNHARLGVPQQSTTRMAAMFCIDEREESLRRHLEEVMPGVETYGYAGFYGVAMAYQGLEDVRPRDLCPVTLRPSHRVVERAIDAAEGRDAARRRRSLGSVTHATGVGSQTLVRGSVVSTAAGLASVVPLIGRALFPRAAERVSHGVHHGVVGHVRTRLDLERDPSTGPDDDGLLPGFTPDEMAEIVAGALRTMGLTRDFPPLVMVVGHGSSSLNNPHESAHDCGATGGGRGGPNARAFAVMANHPRVRDLLAGWGIQIPDGTHFVGAYHNTCDDSMSYYDEDLVPVALHGELEAAREGFERARRLDAHERCRRFESAPLSLDAERALSHVEARAVDLAQPRPEYGHATNAVCFVGRRARTRGLFMDRRAFLVSYDPESDPQGDILAALLRSVGPVGAGISLEYYFSYVDPTGYGCGTKLPHNIVGLVGVMDGHASDLRTGLPWQMVEIHEPVRLLTVVEAEPETLMRIAEREPAVGNLVGHGWIQLVAWSPSTGALSVFAGGEFRPHRPESDDLPVAPTSVAYYSGERGHLPCARIEAGLTDARSASAGAEV